MLNFNFWLRLAFITALVATLGSLYFSEVMGFPPCTLCWYQRIGIYPLIAILGVALWSGDKNVWRYVLPLSLAGLVISVYHNLIYYNVISEGIIPCQKGVSCATRFIAWLGFIDIPLLSFAAFLLINIFAILAMRAPREP